MARLPTPCRRCNRSKRWASINGRSPLLPVQMELFLMDGCTFGGDIDLQYDDEHGKEGVSRRCFISPTEVSYSNGTMYIDTATTCHCRSLHFSRPRKRPGPDGVLDQGIQSCRSQLRDSHLAPSPSLSHTWNTTLVNAGPRSTGC